MNPRHARCVPLRAALAGLLLGLNAAAVAAELPYGTVTVRVERGGLFVPSDGSGRGDPIIMARAAVLVHLDVEQPAG